jgi:lysophospholipase L1-like esterase
MPTEATSTFRIVLTGVDVEVAKPGGVIVAVGDSITDGAFSTVDAGASWPEGLARRLAAAGRTEAVVNAGIGGNRLLRDGTWTGAGRALLARLDADVFALDGVESIILLIGINDIGWPDADGRGRKWAPLSDLPTANQIADGYRQVVLRAHARGTRVIGGTLIAFGGVDPSGFYTTEKEVIRQAVNARVRSGDIFDAVIDFDAALRDPSQPSRLLPDYDSGDNVHPSDHGYAAMANAVDLSLLRETRASHAP